MVGLDERAARVLKMTLRFEKDAFATGEVLAGGRCKRVGEQRCSVSRGSNEGDVRDLQAA